MMIVDAFRWVGGLELNDDDNVGTISIKNKMVAVMIYHPLLMIFLIKVTLFNCRN